MNSELKYRNFLFKSLAVGLGLFLALLFVELSLRIGGCIIIAKKKNDSFQTRDRLIIFSGDSWTHGADADSGKGFFDLLKGDGDFKNLFLVNVGYGGNTCFQAVNAIINYGKVPDIVVVNAGINNWHLMGFEEFVNNAEDYFTAEEMSQLRKDFRLYNQCPWLKEFRIYKLLRYLVSVKQNKIKINHKFFEDRLGSVALRNIYKKITEEYSDDYRMMCKIFPKVLNESDNLSLDQKFFLTSLNLGFCTKESEEVLKKADLFYPEKLKVISYDVYREIGIQEKHLGDARRLFIKWAFKLLNKWSIRYNVIVIVQTYPNIKNTYSVDNSFVNINEFLTEFAYNNGFKVIDHNTNGVDWLKYRTSWHVNNEGHRLMKEIIKASLMRNKDFIKLLGDGL